MQIAAAGYLESVRSGKATGVTEPRGPLDLFVYGTLKRGQAAHRHYCRDAQILGEARVTGVLRLHDDGYPVLIVPEHTILALGTTNTATDALRAAVWPGARVGSAQADEAFARDTHLGAGDRPTQRDLDPGFVPREEPWREVRGEVLRFHDPDRELPPIEAYEGVAPAAPGTYARVLVAVQNGIVRCACTFAAAYPQDAASLRPFPADSWP